MSKLFRRRHDRNNELPALRTVGGTDGAAPGLDMAARRVSTASNLFSASAPMTPTGALADGPRRVTMAYGLTRDELRRISEDLHAARRREKRKRIALSLLDGSYEFISIRDRAVSLADTEEWGQEDDPLPEADADAPAEEDAARVEGKDATARSAAAPAKGRPADGAAALWVLVALMVACGCGCALPVEVLHARDRGCADLISLCEYVYGIAMTAPAALSQERELPLATHAGLAALALAHTLLLNSALRSDLPLPVLSTLKNGALVANVVVGVCLLGRRYTGRQLIALLLVTAGLVTSALAGAGSRASPADGEAPARAPGLGALLAIGSALGALLCRAAGGALQEEASKRSGRRPPVAELLFYRNLLGLPLVLLRCSAISEHAGRWYRERIPGLPAPFALLALNLVMDFMCKRLMTRIIAVSSALTASLVLTVQKFLSFALAVVIQGPEAAGISSRGEERALWFGSVAVLIGTCLYAAVPQREAGAAADTSRGGAPVRARAKAAGKAE